MTALAADPVHAQDNWSNLFDGKNLDGWTQKTGKAKYFVEDGCIVGEAVQGTKTNSFLCTTKDYDNFIMELDFKCDPLLNSGVQIRGEYSTQPTSVEWKGKTINIPAGYVYGYQVEIDADAARKRMWTGGIYDERRRFWLYPGQLGGTAEEFSRQGNRIFNTNDWNHLRIEAVGDSIKAYLNGVLCAHFNDSMTPKGFIGLQVHMIGDDTSKAGRQVRFKNIRLKTVKPTPAKPEPAPNTLTEQEKNSGWRLLWDGHTTDGWRSAKADAFPAAGWAIRGSELMVTNATGEESAGGGDIITRKRYANFELTADFKTTPKCNSGIKIFVQPSLAPITGKGDKAAIGSAIGLEFQILDDARHPDAKLGRDGDRTLGSLYDLIPAPKDKKELPIGEWNQARILSQGKHVEFWLNGAKTVEFERGAAEFLKHVAESKYHNIAGFGEWTDGHILLQEHGSEVSFRNVKIRELPAN